MPGYSRHFLVCVNERTPDSAMPCCAANGAVEVYEALRRARDRHGLAASVYVTRTGCLGPCPRTGATVVVYPEAVWYTGVESADVAELVDRHMLRGQIVDRLRDRAWYAADDASA